MTVERMDNAVLRERFGKAASSRRWDEVIEEADSVLKSPGNSLAEKSWAHLELGKAVVKRDAVALQYPLSEAKDRGETLLIESQALPSFLRVARCEVPAPAEDQLSARWLAADTYHEVLSDRMSAYRSYKEILQAHGSDPAVRARAQVEIAACLMELARSKGAYYNEVRRACEQLKEQVPASFVRAHAVADLMIAESYYFERDYDKAVSAANGFDSKYPRRKREIAACDLMLGKIAVIKGDEENAAKYFLKVMDARLPENENFFWAGKDFNIGLHAAGALAGMADQKGLNDLRDRAREYIRTQSYKEREGPAFDRFYHHDYYSSTN